MLVHRRRIRPDAPAAKGPGGTIGPLLAPLTWIGWLSILAAVAYLVIKTWPLATAGGGLRPDDFRPTAVLATIGTTALVLLPAALELGYPAVARRNRWLLAGVVVLAVSPLARPLGNVASDWIAGLLSPDPNLFGVDQPSVDPFYVSMAVSQLVGVVLAVVRLAGWVAVYRGLAAAGARPGRRLLVPSVLVVAAVSATLDGLAIAGITGSTDAGQVVVVASSVAALAVNLVASAATAAVMVALLRGAAQRRVPLAAWRFGAAAALAWIIAFALELVLAVWRPEQDGGLFVALLTVAGLLNGFVTWALLVAACLAGLGRGTAERRGLGPRRSAFVVRGGRRLRPAGA